MSKDAITPFTHAVAGGIGGMISLTITYPLDIVKTRLQAQADGSNVDYNGTMDAISKIVNKQGVAGLYRGLLVSLFQTWTNQFIYFYWYETLRPVYHNFTGSKHLSVIMQLLLGIQAASFNCIMTLPVAVVTTRTQTSNSNSNIISLVSSIVELEGITGLWKGLQPSLILTINPSITFLVFERLKAWLEKGTNGKRSLSAWEVFLIGAVAKTIATVFTYPYIMAKTKLQSISSEDKVRYTSSLEVLKSVYQRKGFLGLFQGMNAQIVKAVITQAILFMMKEEILTLAVWLLKLITNFRSKGKVNVK